MYKNNIIKFLGIEEANVKNVKYFDKTIEIFVTLKEPKPKSCPHCGCKTLHYHDKRIQKVKDIPYQHKQVNFNLERKRYICPNCHKKSRVNPSFIIKGYQITKRLYFYILEEFKKMKSASDIAKECGISITSVFRYVEIIKLEKTKAPRSPMHRRIQRRQWRRKISSKPIKCK